MQINFMNHQQKHNHTIAPKLGEISFNVKGIIMRQLGQSLSM